MSVQKIGNLIFFLLEIREKIGIITRDFKIDQKSSLVHKNLNWAINWQNMSVLFVAKILQKFFGQIIKISLTPQFGALGKIQNLSKSLHTKIKLN